MVFRDYISTFYPWCINRAKFNYEAEEWLYILERYFVKGGDFYRRHNEKYNN